jgi:uncharacterized protein with PIN domain
MPPSIRPGKRDTPKFIADCHLGKLAKYLRLMGVDTLYFSHIEDDDLIVMANDQDRTILTRDRSLSERKNAPVFFLEATDTKVQLKTVIQHFDLKDHHDPFSRCIVCNTPLQVVAKERIIDSVPKNIQKNFDYFEYCPTCDQVYWQGDHYRHMMAFLEEVLEDS